MPTLTIDNQSVTVPEGTMLLEAAAQVGVKIPTLCHRPDLTALVGCMICVVREDASGRMLPSCATPAAEGMRISTASAEVLAMRRSLLELLLSTHVADCEAPCQFACPCHFDIPVMLGQIAVRDDAAALATVLARLALPVTLGHICPAPCEKVCRRAVIDAPVAICAVKRFSGEQGAFVPASVADTGKRVVVVGAGPTGLSAAFYLRLQGHTCHVLEATAQVGDALLANVTGRLPSAAHAQDVARIRALGVTFAVGSPLHPADAVRMLADADAMVLAAGTASASIAEALGIPVQKGCVVVDKQTHQSANSKVFSGGGAIQSCRIAVLACAHGRVLAENLHAWLTMGKTTATTQDRFQSRAGKLSREMLTGLLVDAADGGRLLPAAGGTQPEALDAGMLRDEARRCLHCACLKQKNCQFRALCTESRTAAPVFSGERAPPARVHAQPDVVFEAAKCVLCGICVRTAAGMGAACGPAFHGRGFDMQIGPPVGRMWAEVPREVMLACVQACPTGALAAAYGPVSSER